ncbi:MAG: hypothetical protein NT140_04635 [Deltaproteobacteria bacterium]|nr:hypothetical protein [Deltaproteobacteria bacterium]
MKKGKAIEQSEKVEVDVTDNLNRCAWKLQGVAGLFFAHDDGGKDLSRDEVNGISFLLEQIAGDILANTENL